MQFDKYVGLPFTEYDCYGLVVHVYAEHGITIPTFDIGTQETKRTYLNFLKEISKNWERVEDLKVLDIIAMAYLPQHPDIVQHFGIYIGEGKILHTLNKTHAHIVKITDPTIEPTIKGIYRWIN